MHFIRHGQSAFNAMHDRLGRDPQIVDAPLTPMGIRQAQRAAEQLSGQGIAHIIVSPYTRALQTASAIAEILKVPMHIEPLAGERSLFSCDIGTPATALRAAWGHLDFAALESENWWPENGELHEALSQRVAAFKNKWREKLSNGGHALVSHWYFLNALIGRDLENGQVVFKKLF